ncbi:unnamed protein product [Cladocopium goreaui]|uniref:Coiled-coil domain-containing protein C16orf93-like n=1 Tax=Cladocopium goreaui TaxID=2562237 RepID=A0A9P1FXD6_9DINO|nr:unnamed protein product [Cladocopium goreaui]
MTHCDVCLRVGEPLGGAVVTGGDPMGPVVTGAVARSQTSDSETAGDDHGVRGGPNTAAGAGAFVQAGKDFMPSEQEQAEAEMRRLRSKQEPEDERSAMIKQRVEEGVKRLMEDFELKLKEQDERFQTMLNG